MSTGFRLGSWPPPRRRASRDRPPISTSGLPASSVEEATCAMQLSEARRSSCPATQRRAVIVRCERGGTRRPCWITNRSVTSRSLLQKRKTCGPSRQRRSVDNKSARCTS